MSKEDHLKFLTHLDRSYGEGHLSWPRKEGAFYFGHDIFHDEYTDKYRAKCKENGWIE